MKGSIRPNHIPVNKYELIFIGLPKLTPTEVSGLEEELNVVDMPDRTKASGGRTNPSEMTIMIPMHHTVEIFAMEAWWIECQDPVSPTYKKNGALLMESVGLLGPTRTYTLTGSFLTKRKLPDLEMANDGELACAEFTISVDQMFPS